MRSPDGRWSAPEADARRLQAETSGWTVWWGRACGRFFAVTKRPAPPLLVEARDTGQLVERMSRATTTPANEPPRPRGAHGE